MAVFLMLICYKDLFDYNVSNYNHLLTPRITSQTDLWADPEEIFLKLKNITDKEMAILIEHECQMLVTLKMLKHMYDHLRNGRRRGIGDGEQSRSTSFSGFLTPSSILSRLFFQFELLRSITSCVQTPLIDKKRKDGLLRMVIASFYKCLYIKVTFYKYIFAFTLRKF